MKAPFNLIAPAPEDSRPGPDVLRLMQERGGWWAAYQNHDLGHSQLGHLRFLQFGGKENTFSVPPNRYPDTHDSIGWRYLHVGYVNLTTGQIVPSWDEAASNHSTP